MILLIDNYDGCVYNLYQLAGTCLTEAEAKETAAKEAAVKKAAVRKASGETTLPDIRIVRNDRITAAEIRELAPSHIIISGGAVAPEKAGNDMEIVREMAGKCRILGVCLGFRVICSAFGGREIPLQEPMQGKPSRILLEQGGKTESGIFDGIPEAFMGARYQSTSIAPESITAPLHIIACSEDGDIMGVEAEMQNHDTAGAAKHAPLIGVQWHPESFMSEYGMQLMRNFLNL